MQDRDQASTRAMLVSVARASWRFDQVCSQVASKGGLQLEVPRGPKK